VRSRQERSGLGAPSELGDGEAGGVGHEEAAGLFEDFLEFHLLVVFPG